MSSASHLSNKDTELYGQPRPKVRPKDVLPSSTSSTFASHLSSLLSTSSSSTTKAARARPSKSHKDDIFTAHNRGAKKRALADLDGENEKESEAGHMAQQHRTSGLELDSDDRRRAKRKMEEKARLYAAMKRGDYVDPGGSRHGAEERAPLVDFDRKWAEDEEAQEHNESGTRENEDTSSEEDSEEEMVEFEDEFGRTKRGTRTEMLRLQRRQRAQNAARQELNEMSARPVQSVEHEGKVIFGDTIQTAAFNPDAKLQEAMSTLAAKRDRSLTPPDETRYDANKEVRSKGVGFYQFSGTKGERASEMGNLDRMRKETEEADRARKERREKKEREIQERRKKIKEKRGEREADQFLDSLG